jgi:hypothetical protein
MVSVMAVARAASTALPPFSSIRSPAWAASGWEVATTLRAKTGILWEGYGNCHEVVMVVTSNSTEYYLIFNTENTKAQQLYFLKSIFNNILSLSGASARLYN